MCPVGAAHPLAGSTEVCHILEEDCGCMVARRKQGWLAHIAGGGPASHSPWPAGSDPGYTKDLQ